MEHRQNRHHSNMNRIMDPTTTVEGNCHSRTVDEDTIDRRGNLSCNEDEEDMRNPFKVVPPDVLPLFDTIPQTTASRRENNTTRIVLMSDTHGRHRQVPLPKSADVLIHAGDLTQRGEAGTLQDLANYLADLQQQRQGTPRFQRVILIAGNHDVTLQPSFYQRQQRYARVRPMDCEKAVQALKASCTYLEDKSCSLWPNSCGLRVYGSPWSPEFGEWAFTKPLGEMEPLWQAIPDDTDILITHGPPYKRGDQVHRHEHVGCPALLDHVQRRVKPRLHVFGHIHEERGWVGYDGQTLFVNASNVDLRYRPIQPCIVVDVPHDKSQPVQLVQPVSPVTDFDSFITWLNDQGETYVALTRHLRNIHDKMDDWMDWQHPWTALSDLPNVFCMLAMHRDERLRNDLRQALGDLYANSF